MHSDLTIVFLRLRLSDSDFPIELRSIETNIWAHRERALQLCRNCKGNNSPPIEVILEFCGLCFECWNTLANLPATNQFSLPMHYQSTNLSELLESCWNALFTTETNVRSASNHKIFCGCKGVGKTTDLCAIGMISAALLEETLAIYWTYESSVKIIPTLDQLIQDIQIMKLSTAPSFECTLSSISDSGRLDRTLPLIAASGMIKCRHTIFFLMNSLSFIPLTRSPLGCPSLWISK